MTTICFDFDGVLAEYNGWKGHEHIGEPIEAMIELVKELYGRGYFLALCTTRLNPNPFPSDVNKLDDVVAQGDALEIVTDWLIKNNIFTCFHYVDSRKPMADYYIDDKALRFGGVVIDCGSAMYEGALDYDDIRRIIIRDTKDGNK